MAWSDQVTGAFAWFVGTYIENRHKIQLPCCAFAAVTVANILVQLV